MKKRNKNKLINPKAIIFDIGGVLLFGDKKIKYGHQNINVHEYMCKKFNLSLKQWFKKIETPYKKSITSEWSEEKVLKEMSKKLKSQPEKINKLFIKAHKKHFKKNKTLYNKIKKLNKKYLIGILSDQTYFSKKALLNKKNLKYFNPIILSCDVKTRKPNKDIYQLLKKEINKLKKIKYSEILFIDNREYNLKPAKRLGMKTILYKNNKHLFKQPVWRRLFEK